MKRNLTVTIGILSGFAFLLAFFLGVGVSSQTVFGEIAPFFGIMAFVIFGLTKKSSCFSKRSC